jgi:anti-sigma regulatory factor (Ser/Thr protein kinase)
LAHIQQWLAAVLADLAEDLLQDLLLICNELVANTYDHAQAPRRLHVRRSYDHDMVRIEVEDSSPDRLPTIGTSSLGAFRGRGLTMVDTLSRHRWGTDLACGTKTVWAELPLT